MGGGRYIAVEGPPGAGKSALGRALARRAGARLVEEPRDNPFLKLFYEEPRRHALPVQLSFLLARVQHQAALAQGDLFAPGGLVTSYLLDKDRIYAGLTLSPDELSLYGRVHGLLAPRSLRPDFVVCLLARPEVLLGRLRKRARPHERAVTLEYIEEVARSYHAYFFHWAKSPLLVVDTSEVDLESDSGVLDSLWAIIRRHKGGVQHYIPTLGSRP